MKYSVYVLYFLMSFTGIYADKPSAITFQGGGRLGDKLLVYCKAKWFSYKFDLPFLCSGFPLKEQLMLVEKENHLTKTVEASFKYKKVVMAEKDINPLASDTLFIVDYYASSQEMSDIVNIKKIFNNNPSFLEELRLQISPRKPVAKLALPEDKLTVAVHVRRGSGGDKPLLHKNTSQKRAIYSDKHWPTKFPPDDFYIEQILRLSAMVENQPMYVHIFTDFKYPDQIVEKYKKALNLPNITFGYRKNNQYANYVIEDLFAMTQFQYIIHSHSNFSNTAYIIGDHTYAIRPTHGTWHGDHLTIDEIVISCRNDDGTISKEIISTI